jgi:hypothetical protein
MSFTRPSAGRRRALASTVALWGTMAIFAGSCAIGRTQTRDRSDAEEESRSTSMEITSDAAEAKVSRSRQLVMEGKFDDAESLLNGVYGDLTTERETRAEALYELGRLHGHLLNPDRDAERAAQHFEKLLAEFPESPLRKDAEEQLAALRKR